MSVGVEVQSSEVGAGSVDEDVPPVSVFDALARLEFGHVALSGFADVSTSGGVGVVLSSSVESLRSWIVSSFGTLRRALGRPIRRDRL